MDTVKKMTSRQWADGSAGARWSIFMSTVNPVIVTKSFLALEHPEPSAIR